MPSRQAHNPGCTVPSGSNGSSMPIEHSSKRDRKIVSSGTMSVVLPGGGCEALSQSSESCTRREENVLGLCFFFFFPFFSFL